MQICADGALSVLSVRHDGISFYPHECCVDDQKAVTFARRESRVIVVTKTTRESVFEQTGRARIYDTDLDWAHEFKLVYAAAKQLLHPHRNINIEYLRVSRLLFAFGITNPKTKRVDGYAYSTHTKQVNL